MSAPKPHKPPPAAADELVDVLAQVAFATMAVLNRLAADNDLSLTLLRVGGILRDRRVRITRLAQYLGLEKSTMTGLVDRAEKRGIMTRAPNAEDGRAVDVFLTKEGLSLARRLEGQLRDALSPLTRRLNGRDQRKLQALLRHMIELPER